MKERFCGSRPEGHIGFSEVLAGFVFTVWHCSSGSLWSFLVLFIRWLKCMIVVASSNNWNNTFAYQEHGSDSQILFAWVLLASLRSQDQFKSSSFRNDVCRSFCSTSLLLLAMYSILIMKYSSIHIWQAFTVIILITSFCLNIWPAKTKDTVNITFCFNR